MNLWMQFSKLTGEIILKNELNAAEFLFKDLVYIKEFESILANITSCYFRLRNEKKKVPLNDENGIRDILLIDYIRKEPNLSDFLFDKEITETVSSGRTDIRVLPINPLRSYEAYYILEYKRLDNKARRGSSGLNSKYIKDGIQRFTSGYYSSFYKTNAMIGFVVTSIDINKNVNDINYLLENNFKHISTNSLISKESFIKNYEFHYSSCHQTKKGLSIKLYHLMFDFS